MTPCITLSVTLVCHYVESRFLFIIFRNVYYAECPYSECRYAECHGAAFIHVVYFCSLNMVELIFLAISIFPARLVQSIQKKICVECMLSLVLFLQKSNIQLTPPSQ
jgi:hypothetical protein